MLQDLLRLRMRETVLFLGVLLSLLCDHGFATGSQQDDAVVVPARPNIVFCMADDWSWPHAGALGDPVVQTPHFDRVAREGVLDNTIVVVSGDNGMPFPRCKATLYDQGTRVPLAVRWGNRVCGERCVSDFVSLCDFAPTFLEAADLPPSAQMTGRSLIPVLLADGSGQIDLTRTFVLTGMERHVYSYPSRALRTKDFLYIRNFAPETWPTGEVDGHNPKYDFAIEPWPTEPGAFAFNIDPSPSKQFLRLHRDEHGTQRFADLSFAQRPIEELYDLRHDPNQVQNVINDPDFASTRQQLRRQLNVELIKSEDPRMTMKRQSDTE